MQRMIFFKTTGENMKIHLSKSQWEHIGKTAGWDSDTGVESEESLKEFRKGRSQSPMADVVRESFDASNYEKIPYPVRDGNSNFPNTIKENDRFYDTERHQTGTFVLKTYHNTTLWMLLYDSGEIEELTMGDLKKLLKKKQ